VQGFCRERRLRRRGDFVRVQEEGLRVTAPHFVLLVAAQPSSRVRGPDGVLGPDPEPRPSRLGLVVTRKIGNAVTRNRIKRVCRECFRTSRSLVPPGIDLVIIARQGADALGTREVGAEWATVKGVLEKRCKEALAGKRSRPHVSAGVQTSPRPSRGRGGAKA
jgi:ribonuclease P protein component